MWISTTDQTNGFMLETTTIVACEGWMDWERKESSWGDESILSQKGMGNKSATHYTIKISVILYKKLCLKQCKNRR